MQKNCDANGLVQLSDLELSTPIIVSAKGYQSKSFIFDRGKQNDWLPDKQLDARLECLDSGGHKVAKIELPRLPNPVNKA